MENVPLVDAGETRTAPRPVSKRVRAQCSRSSSEVAGVIDRLDWSASPLGAPETWPRALRGVVDLLVGSKFPMLAAWGPDLAVVYNDGYAPMLGDKHPAAMGRPLAEVWPEIWDAIEPFVARALSGESVYHENMAFTLDRHGFPEEARFTFSYSPIHDDAGGIGGTFCVCTETTERHLADKARQRLIDVIEQSPDFIGLADPEGRVVFVNEAGRKIVGFADGDAVRRATVLDFFFPEDLGYVLDTMLPQVLTEGAWQGEHRVRDFTTGEPKLLDCNLFATRDGEGRFLGVASVVRDTSERRAAEEALRAAFDRNAEILESIGDAFYAIDHEWRFTYVNGRTLELWERGPDDLIGKVIWDVFPQVVGTEPYEAHLKAMEQRRSVRLEAISPVLHQWLDISVHPMRDGGLSVYFRDISAHKQALAHQQLLIGELNHRVKNTLATVQAIAAQSLRGTVLGEMACNDFQSRLFALSRAHDVLTDEKWEGADICDVARCALDAYEGDGRCVIEGPRVRLKPRTALALAMAFHELATNAVKYGALSNEDGRVSLRWEAGGDGDEPGLTIRWREQGGPPVAHPTRAGFGSRLIERGLAQQMEGGVRVEYRPDGVVCTIQAPRSALQGGDAG